MKNIEKTDLKEQEERNLVAQRLLNDPKFRKLYKIKKSFTKRQKLTLDGVVLVPGINIKNKKPILVFIDKNIKK